MVVRTMASHSAARSSTGGFARAVASHLMRNHEDSRLARFRTWPWVAKRVLRERVTERFRLLTQQPHSPRP